MLTIDADILHVATVNRSLGIPVPVLSFDDLPAYAQFLDCIAESGDMPDCHLFIRFAAENDHVTADESGDCYALSDAGSEFLAILWDTPGIIV